MKTKEAQAIADKAFSKLQDALAAGRSDEMKTFLAFASKFHKYSWNNVLLIFAQCEEATHVAGYRAWQNLGRQVRKGEKGIAILAPMTFKKKREEKGKDDDDETTLCFRVIFVYDVSQTDGNPLPDPMAISGDPAEMLTAIEQVISDHGIGIREEYRPGALGVSLQGEILIRPDLAPGERFAVLVHELGHELLHDSESRKKESKKLKETEAEAVAFIVCESIGLDTRTRSSDYISLYEDDGLTLAGSLERIQKTAAHIIEQLHSIAPAAPQAVSPATTVETPPGEVGEEEEEQPLRTGRADYQERKEARIDRYHERAARSRDEAEALHKRANDMASVIPFGQPILVGHHSEKRDRRYRERIHNTFGKSFEAQDKAKYWADRAASAEDSYAISSDDPEAIPKLQERLTELKEEQELLKRLNAAWRKHGYPKADETTAWEKIAVALDCSLEDLEAVRTDLAFRSKWENRPIPAPPYNLANRNGNMRRISQRIEQLVASANAETSEVDHGVCKVVENAEVNRVQILFDGKPPQETRDLLKKNGFRWSRKEVAWQRMLNNAGRYAAGQVVKQLTSQEDSNPGDNDHGPT